MTVRLTALSVVAAAVIGGGLAVQMAAGSDPALGPKQAKVAAKAGKSSAGSSTQTTQAAQSTVAPTEVAPTQVAPTEVAPTQSAPAPVTSSTS
jgi:hypothetical protein